MNLKIKGHHLQVGAQALRLEGWDIYQLAVPCSDQKYVYHKSLHSGPLVPRTRPVDGIF